MTEEKKHVEETVEKTTRNVELTGDDSNAGTQAPQEKQGEAVQEQHNTEKSDKQPNSDSSDKSE